MAKRITKAQIRLVQIGLLEIWKFIVSMIKTRVILFYIGATIAFYFACSKLLPEDSILIFIGYNILFFIITKILEVKIAPICYDESSWWNLDGWEFEEEVAKVLRKSGYKKVKVTKGSGDGGVDIIFYKNSEKFIAQCKHYKNPVGPEPVRALWGVKDDFKADYVVMIASSGLTKASARFISNKPRFLMWTLQDILRLANKN